ncbi:zinc ribbon domain-containing protein [Luteolibacter sp. LG18]|uniref:zinc ribbon domain-containing protein n=1 Tax=Luteolibacter sp. LG18 TaxID=2819286 RepID=UPI0030C6C27E
MPSSPSDPPVMDGPATGAPIEVPKKPIPPPLPGRSGSAAEVRSLDRHACPECGGKGEWDPAKKQLVCPYCGNIFDRVGPPPDLGAVVEHDLDQTLAELGQDAGRVDTATRRVQCNNCHAVLVRSGETVAQHCDFCGSPELLDYNDIAAPVKPESVLPAQISKEQAYHSLKNYLASKWFAPGDLKRRNLVDRINRVYLPYWTFDSNAECPWTAESGTYYYVTVQDRDSEGRSVTRQERRVSWSPASGHVSTFFDDVVISGSAGLDGDLLRKIEPFPTKELVPYETMYVSGWQVEQYQVPLPEAARRGFGAMQGMLQQMCASEVPGDTYRNLQIYPEFSGKTFKHILAPVWLLAYQYRGKTWQGVVNGVTGTTAAKFPISPWKVALVVLIVLAVVALILMAKG